MPWQMAVQKFNKIATTNAKAGQRAGITTAVTNLEQISVRELMEQLGAVAPDSDSPRIVPINKEN
jgi:hypothetical protein